MTANAANLKTRFIELLQHWDARIAAFRLLNAAVLDSNGPQKVTVIRIYTSGFAGYILN